jgi:hypothetical protein
MNSLKIAYKKEIREGRFFLFPLIIGLYFLSIHIKSFGFINLIVVFVPAKFINTIWSNKDEINFYLNCGKKCMIKSAQINDLILFFEQNIFLGIAFLSNGLVYGFMGLYIELFFILNIFILTYKTICHQLFFLNGLLIINHQILFMLKLVILLICSYTIMIPFIFIKSFLLLHLMLLFALYIYTISFNSFKKKISIKKIIRYAGN